MSFVADDQRRLLSALRRHRVDFIVIGGVAAQVHGWDGATTDLDITVAPGEPNRVRLEKALASVGARVENVGVDGTAFTTRHGRLEIMSRTDGPRDYAAWAARAEDRAVTRTLVVGVADADDILLSKEAANRDKDIRSLPALRRAFLERGLIEAGAVRGEVAPAPPEQEGIPAELVDRLGPPPGPDDPAGTIMWQSVAAELYAARTDERYQGASAAAKGRRAKLERDIERVRALHRR